MSAIRHAAGAAALSAALFAQTPSIVQAGLSIDSRTEAAAQRSIEVAPRGGNSRAGFKIVPRVNPGATAKINVQRWIDFEASVSLKVRTDPSLVPTARVIEMVESIEMTDGAGLRILRGYDIDIQHDLVVGYSGGTAEITAVSGQPGALTITALIKDGGGRIVTPPASALAAYTTAGERLCFAEDVRLEAASANVPMSFGLLLDRSGSMQSVIGDVRHAAQTFLDALPNGATCRVGAFAGDGGSFEEGMGFGTKHCQAANFPMWGLRAGGSTDLYTPLSELYAWMAASERAAHQKAVLIVTDGLVNQNEQLAATVQSLKGDVVTFVYYLGGNEEKWLRGLADSYLAHEGDLKDQLPRYFRVLSEAYTKQTVLRQMPCAPAQGRATR